MKTKLWLTIVFCTLSGCMKLGKQGSLETDIETSVSDEDVKILLERIVGTPQTDTEVLVNNDTLIFYVKSKRAREVKYAFEQTDTETCAGPYSEWLDASHQVSKPIPQNGEYKLCLLGKFGPRISESPSVYSIHVEILEEEGDLLLEQMPESVSESDTDNR